MTSLIPTDALPTLADDSTRIVLTQSQLTLLLETFALNVKDVEDMLQVPPHWSDIEKNVVGPLLAALFCSRQEGSN